jgi:uncharacterized protein involved in response to NO
MSAVLPEVVRPRGGVLGAMTDEGLRLFFPLAAGYAVLTPAIWVLAFGFALPFAHNVPVTQWHAHELVFGVFGAALAGFLTSAIPEWTDTPRRAGRALLVLAALWLPGRCIGLFGIEALLPLALATDAAFLALLLWFAVAPMIARRSTRHLSIAAWTAALLGAHLACGAGWLARDWALAGTALYAALVAFAILFALSLSRVNTVVVNLALDPTGASTPYRPHPGRQNLAAAMAALHLAATLAWPESRTAAWLALAAGAAFLDRQAEWFIGRPALRPELLALGGGNALAGLAFLAIGAAELGAPWPRQTGVHLLAVGGLGLAVLAIFGIAGLRHTGRALHFPWQARAALALLVIAVAVRVAPDLAGVADPSGLHHAAAALAWSAAFAVWLHGFLPILRDPSTPSADHC